MAITMRPLWLALAAIAAACSPSPQPTAAENHPSPEEAERRHATECARGVVERGEVIHVGPSRYRGRPVVSVSLSSPDDDLVDAYYGEGPGCDLVAMVGGARLETEVHPGTPFQSLSEARRAALGARGGAVAGWALERNAEGDGRWAYRFDVESGGRLQAVYVDALGGPRVSVADAPPAPQPSPPAAPPRDATSPPPARPAAGPPPSPAVAPKLAKNRGVSLDDLIITRKPGPDAAPPPPRPKPREALGDLALPTDLYDQRH
jgi:uncharacterized membrane protein YkoI